MSDLTFEDIFALAGATSDPSPEERLKTLFTWHRDRLVEIGKLCIGVSASLTGSVILAVWKGDTANVAQHWPLLVLGTAFATALFGIASFMMASAIRKEYVTAIRWLDWSKAIVKSQAAKATPTGGVV